MSRARALAALLAGIAAVTMLAGCSVESATEKLCNLSAALEELGDGLDGPAAAAKYTSMALVAPFQLKADLVYLAGIFGQLGGVDLTDPEALTEALKGLGVEMDDFTSRLGDMGDRLAGVCD